MYPHLTQLAECSAVDSAETERSLVRLRQWGIFLFLYNTYILNNLLMTLSLEYEE